MPGRLRNSRNKASASVTAVPRAAMLATPQTARGINCRPAANSIGIQSSRMAVRSNHGLRAYTSAVGTKVYAATSSTNAALHPPLAPSTPAKRAVRASGTAKTAAGRRSKNPRSAPWSASENSDRTIVRNSAVRKLCIRSC